MKIDLVSRDYLLYLVHVSIKPFIYNCLVAASCNRMYWISKVYCKLLMNIPAKIPSASTTIIFGSPNVTNKFPKSHSAAWSDVIYFIPMAAPIPNPVIQSRNVRILQDKSRSGMSPCIQKSINTTLNRVSESIV